MMCANNKHICNMLLCSPCQAKMREDSMAVLLRRDEFGNNLLCNDCRRAIYKNNVDAQNGFHNFTYENPNTTQKKTTQPTLCTSRQSIAFGCDSYDASWEQWFCKRCHSRVWAKPRVFDGENEPEEWWWCKTCKKEKMEKMQRKMELDKAQRKVEQLKRKRKALRDRNIHDKNIHDRDIQNCRSTLDKWLRQ